MLIECRQRRLARPMKVGRKDKDVGSKSKLFGTFYHFQPQSDLTTPNGGDPLAHVCEVKDPRAIERLLSLPEAYNEFGKPPRVSDAERAVTSGQPKVVTEMLDSDDKPGKRDSEPYSADPLARARELRDEWTQTMLDKGIKDIIKSVPGLSLDETALLYEGEKKGQNRAELLDALSEGPTEQQRNGETEDIKLE